ncbi:MAG: TlpA family protein disulfide reductase [Betaproteobacteria bacterium]
MYPDFFLGFGKNRTTVAASEGKQFSNLRHIIWALAYIVLAGCGCDSAGTPSVQPLPPVTLSSLGEGAFTTTEALHGAPLVINIWATWCEPCRREMPELERWSKQLTAQGVRLIGITVDRDHNLAREFARAYRLTFPLYAEGESKSLQSAWRVDSLPQTLFVTGDGRLVTRVHGVRDWNGAEGERLLAQAFTPPGVTTR